MVNLKKGHFVGYLMLVAVLAGSLVYMNVSKADSPFQNEFDKGTDDSAAQELNKIEGVKGIPGIVAAIIARNQSCTIAAVKSARLLARLPADKVAQVLGLLPLDLAQRIFVEVARLNQILAAEALVKMFPGPEGITRAASLMEAAMRELRASLLPGDDLKANALLAEVGKNLSLTISGVIVNPFLRTAEFYRALRVLNPLLATEFKAMMMLSLPVSLIDYVWG